MAAGPSPVELLADCGSCGLEGGIVEIYDALVPACRFGLPARASCRLCGEASEGTFDREPRRSMREIPANRCPACLEELAPSALDDRRCGSCGAMAATRATAARRALATREEVAAALDAWAERDGYAGRDELVEATFCDPDLETIAARLAAGEHLEIVADPFANLGVRTSGGAKGTKGKARPPAPPASRPAAARPRLDETLEDPLAELALTATEPVAAPLPSRPSATPPRSAPPRAIVFPLVSVVAADGEIHPEERRLVDRFLESEGLAPLSDDEFRVHHPMEVAHLVPRERREAVVQLMCEVASADGLPDESERRVIRAYAHAWLVPDDKVDFWMWGYENMSTSMARQLWTKIRRFVLSARWNEEGR